MYNTTELKAAVEQHIENLGLDQRKPANLYQPMAYILSLKGKRIRPILTLLAYQAVSGANPMKAMNLAVAVEVFHNFTLVHDDIMDRAPVRRGNATVHIKWNENIAILSGDALLAFSMDLVTGDFPERAAPLMKEYTRVSLAVCEGQMEDMDLALQEHATIPDYLEMIRKKTAVLLGGCMSLGSLAGGADEEIVGQFREFGESLGIGFQLQDDLMDAFPPEGFGKQVGGDIIENKKTYLLLKAQELADPSQRKTIAALMAENSDSKVEKMLEIFRQLDIESHTQALIHRYFEKAKYLGQALSQKTHFEPLRSYLQEIASRKI
ncbi:MAG: polyprenyl synthetase family protein [Bacteroidia bacterium]|nr:polyprenyl synthetase family protein [Bacteroidia bacterium]